MSLPRLVVAALFAAATLLSGHFARAQNGATLVAIVTAEPNASLTRRVRAELQALGVDVIVLKPPAEASSSMRAPLDQAARSVGAVAAIRLIVSSEGKVEVWVADRVTGKAVVRELETSGRGVSDSTVAVGAVELLRASLMELHSPEPPHGDVTPTPQVTALALPSTPTPAAEEWIPRLGIGFGGGVGIPVGGIGPSVDANIDVWARLAPRLGARALGYLTMAPSHTTTAAGSVDLRSQVFGLALVYDLAEPTGAWVPSLVLGASAAHISTTGTATPPFVSASDSAWAFAPLGGVGVARTMARGLRLRADALAAWAIPTTRIRAPAASIGRWGAPELMLSLGVEVLWGG